jgi:phosphoribosylformimino-5-aminoimidazole carboxamide ribotide isomerase
MRLIPVIDLKSGMVVHAKKGQREHYAPMNSPLCQSSDIEAVINTFLGIYPFDTFYIADLNAITKQGNHDRLITNIVTQYPNITFWVDGGYQPYQARPINYLPVLGSECYSDANADELKVFQGKFILSLDYAASGEPLGAARFFAEPDLWPETVIIMTLGRVGSQQGVDVEKLNHFCQNYPQKQFVAAGGVRDAADLALLKKIGVQQVLIASALHSLAITRAEIDRLKDDQSS